MRIAEYERKIAELERTRWTSSPWKSVCSKRVRRERAGSDASCSIVRARDLSPSRKDAGMPAWSRRVVAIGYALVRQIDTRLTLTPPHGAVNARHPPPRPDSSFWSGRTVRRAILWSEPLRLDSSGGRIGPGRDSMLRPLPVAMRQ